MKGSRLIAVVILGIVRLAAQPAVVGAGYSAPYPIKVAPGQLLTLFVSGVGAGLQSRVAATSLPLPDTLAGISVTLDELMPPPSLNEKVPILAVAPVRDTSLAGVPLGATTAVSIQIPYGLRTSSFLSPLIPPPASLTVSENGVKAVTIPIAPTTDQIHVATTCDANLTTSTPGAPCRPVIAHADGTFVTPDSPAHTGEQVVLYAFGLGPAPPGLVAGAASSSTPQPIVNQFHLLFEPANPNRPGERLLADPVFVGLTPGFAGLYQINFFAPAPPLAFAPADCSTFDSPNGNVAIQLRGGASSDTAAFCVYP